MMCCHWILLALQGDYLSGYRHLGLRSNLSRKRVIALG